MQAGPAAELMAECGFQLHGSVSWGQPLPEPGPGAYIVTLSAPTSTAPLDIEAISQWLTRRPELTMGGVRPATAQVLAEHLAQWWLPTEAIVYIGMATSLKDRVGQYYATELGARGPHAGGAWLKTLTGLPSLTIHWTRNTAPASAESSLLAAFGRAVMPPAVYPDPDLVLPWANLEVSYNGRRRRRRRGHGLRGARGPRRRPAAAGTSHDVHT